MSTIAAAIEEQSSTTKEIAENVNLAQSSANAEEITSEISDINVSAGEIADSSSLVNENAENLNRLAQELSEMVGQFKVE